jgi:hypothetical protein
MKFLYITILASFLISSAQALKCNSGAAVPGSGGAAGCPSKDLPKSDTCYKCVSPTPLSPGGATPVTYVGGCGPTETSPNLNCADQKTQCEGSVLKGTYTECKSDNCMTCSLAPALQASAFLLVFAFAFMLF